MRTSGFRRLDGRMDIQSVKSPLLTLYSELDLRPYFFYRGIIKGVKQTLTNNAYILRAEN